MLDDDLLNSLNIFSGYLTASGYDKVTVIKYFTEVLSVSNRAVVFKEKDEDLTFKIALVTNMHPALPNVKKIMDRFYPIIESCPFSAKVFPRQSLISSNRKLANLSSILASNPFSKPLTPSLPKGFYRLPRCACKVCKEGHFASIVHSPVIPDRGFRLPKPICCKDVNVVYMIVCVCGLHYVGRTSNPRNRWSGHKSHMRMEEMTCNIATHCITVHKEKVVGADKLNTVEEVQNQLKFTLLESVGRLGTEDELKRLEDIWRDRLQSWAPLGLNTRED